MANRKNATGGPWRRVQWEVLREIPSQARCLVGFRVLLVLLVQFVNDIGNDITWNIKLFADDNLLYRLVHNSDDAISLQSDLNKLVEWAKLWQIAFNPRKCYVLRICRTTCPFIHPYAMLGHTLQAVDHYHYLGVSLSEDLNWKPHISWTLQTKPIQHLALSRGTCIIAHRRLKIKPTNRQ